MQSLEIKIGKKQVKDNVPKRIKELQFGILSNQDIVNQAVLEVSDRNSYDRTDDGPNKEITKHGPMDGRMGISGKHVPCETCGQDLSACNGHFGYIRLALPAFHVGYIRRIIEVLQTVCKSCSRILIDDNRRRDYLRSFRRRDLDSYQREKQSKQVREECRKCKECPYCGSINGSIKKVPMAPLKIVHDRFASYARSMSRTKVPPPAKIEFDKSFDEAKKSNPELEKHLKKAYEDLNPLRVLNIFRRIPAADCELLGMNQAKGRPEMFIWQYVPVPPVSIRPSVAQDSGVNEDDITVLLGRIIEVSATIRAGLAKGQTVQTIMTQWEYLQLQLALIVNGDVPGLQQQTPTRPMRGFCQRLKGKQGRFRGNLSGKRVDFSGRTVITPDPNLGIDEVAVPERVAVKMTYPERVSRYNIEKLRQRIRNGNKYPGAVFIIKSNKRKVFVGVIARLNRLEAEANDLEVGDVVERHLEDGDIVLFNRQPSLHKLSILSHRAKIRPWRTFRLNECVCNPYNADFDGDEMNLHVPQTEEARTEAIELMGVKYNLCTPKNGTPIIAAIQDFITAAYLLSNKDNFYDRKTFAQICGYMFNGEGVLDPETGERMPVELPPPTVMKPQRLWTGKQVWNVLMRPNKRYKAVINLDAPCRQYKTVAGVHPDLSEDDAWLVIRNSEVMCGVMDKATVGDGKKDSMFYVIMRDFGPDYAVQAMNRLSKLSAKWLTNQGFSIGINDVYPGEDLVRRKKALLDEAYAKCTRLIEDFSQKRLKKDPGCNEEQTLENKSTGILNAVRQEAGAICLDQLSRWNSPSIMARCGSKGSNINVAQMVAAVGQQSIGNKRVTDGFQDRTLPHFPKSSREPAAKGFVQNSFFSGLSPTEFVFHAMSGREGLVDTAVKTAETGYMSRRLMKSLEDLSAQYDKTVRNSSSGIVQFQYGDDNLDPADMEAKAKPVNFERTFTHAITTTWNNSEDSLLPFEVTAFAKESLEAEREHYARVSLTEEPMSYRDRSDQGVDQFESNRDFLDSLEEFIRKKAIRLAQTRSRMRMLSADEDNDLIDWEVADDVKQKGLVHSVAKISYRALNTFIGLCLSKYKKSVVQPGHAVGAVGAQSIGEPGTQMTLKTFHFAGVAGMSITQGVPRIKEIINASRSISTPVISCELSNKESEHAARIVKSRIEKTYLGDITSHISMVWWKDGGYISIKVDRETIERLQLDVTMSEIEHAITKIKNFKAEKHSTSRSGNYIRVIVSEADENKKRPASQQLQDHFTRTRNLVRILPGVVVRGYPEASRAIIKKEDTKNAHGIEEVSLLVEGYGLKACMTTEGINAYATRTNSIIETLEVLGVEAARKTIIDEIGSVMGQMDIDPRHMALLADVMTYKGEILGITRFGLAKMRDSVLQLASFEKTPDHLFEAAFRMKKDKVEGVSECIIMGQSMSLGTGACNVVRRLALSEEDLRRRPTLFEDCYRDTKVK